MSDESLTLAVPSKGRLEEETRRVFGESRLPIARPGGARSYVGSIKNQPAARLPRRQAMNALVLTPGAPLTHRGLAQGVTFITGHAAATGEWGYGEPEHDWAALANAATAATGVAMTRAQGQAMTSSTSARYDHSPHVPKPSNGGMIAIRMAKTTTMGV